MGLVLNPNKSLKIEKFTDRKINEIAPFLPKDVTILNATKKKKKNKNKVNISVKLFVAIFKKFY